VGSLVLMGGRGRGRAGGGGGGGRGGGEAPPALPAGAVYAFKRDASGQYAYHSTLTSADAASQAGNGFGAAIAVSENAALIAAIGQGERAGVVHEFELDADGTWQSRRTFAPIGGQPNATFGTALIRLDDQAVVTAPGDAGGYGAAYVFRRVAQGRGRGAGGGGGNQAAQGGRGGGNFTWQEVARLTPPATTRADRFGAAVAGDAREIWIGAPGAAGSGRAYIFTRTDGGFDPAALALLGPTELSAAAGVSMSVRGSVAAIGATGAGSGGGVIIYERDANNRWIEQPMIVPPIDEIAPITGDEKRCTGAGRIEMFDCGAADLQAFLPPSRLTHDGHYVEMNDIWGWTDPQTKREWALVGRRDGTTFVDITNPTRPLAVADLPLTDGARPNSWRDMKVYKDHTFIVADGAGPHGMQVFDLTRLRTMKPQANGLPQKVEYDAIYREIASAHNIVINEESGYAYSVGSSAGGTTCGGGLHMIDIREPKQPKFAGCFADASTGRAGTGYSHDAQCVTYKGPDKRYRGREICVGSNENSISIADVTDKSSPKALSRATYPNVAYAHQGWFTEDHRYFFLDDEADEGRGIPKTRTMIWDLTDLENPKLAKEHLGVEATSDHNLYIKGDLMFQANYKSGLRVLNVKDPLNPKEIAFFDTAPYTENNSGYNGAWSVYPFFRSGTIVVNSIEQGLFIVKLADR
jgi:choice-of-anchor B domain-containing protein